MAKLMKTIKVIVYDKSSRFNGFLYEFLKATYVCVGFDLLHVYKEFAWKISHGHQ